MNIYTITISVITVCVITEDIDAHHNEAFFLQIL